MGITILLWEWTKEQPYSDLTQSLQYSYATKSRSWDLY